jgi:hypothetical protein
VDGGFAVVAPGFLLFGHTVIVDAFFGGDHEKASFMEETISGRKRQLTVLSCRRDACTTKATDSEQNSNVYLFPVGRQLPERLTKDIVATLWTSLVHLSQAKKIFLEIV